MSAEQRACIWRSGCVGGLAFFITRCGARGEGGEEEPGWRGWRRACAMVRRGVMPMPALRRTMGLSFVVWCGVDSLGWKGATEQKTEDTHARHILYVV